MKTYISGGLTNIKNPEITKKFYEDIHNICETLGYSSYTPHLHSDPISHPNITPEEVYEMDEKQVQNADIIIAYIGEPSLGTGIELEMAKNLEKIIIIHHEESQRVTRMARGIPGIIAHIMYKNFEDGVQKIKAELERIKESQEGQ